MLERHNAPMGQQRGDCPPKRRRMHKNSNPIEIGSRREPIVDHFLIDHLDGVLFIDRVAAGSPYA